LDSDGIQRLIDETDDLEMRDRNGETALFIATKLGQLEYVRPLLNAGAIPVVGNYYGTSLLAAASREHRRARKKKDLSEEIEIRKCMFMIIDAAAR
jgi:ankyrin repeat protein